MRCPSRGGASTGRPVGALAALAFTTRLRPVDGGGWHLDRAGVVDGLAAERRELGIDEGGDAAPGIARAFEATPGIVDQIGHLIREAGYEPVQRSTVYEEIGAAG